jgi:PIN domain nuclease of toxin-antitoxin system
MRLLLDTHVFLWAVTDSRQLKAATRDYLASAEAVYVSAASIWEIAIKARLGKLDGDAQELAGAIEASGFHELPVTSLHCAAVARLPDHHQDPFDRILIAQSIVEPLRFLTADALLAAYGTTIELI